MFVHKCHTTGKKGSGIRDHEHEENLNVIIRAMKCEFLLLVSCYQLLTHWPWTHLLISGRHLQILHNHINAICQVLCPEKSQALHSFTVLLAMIAHTWNVWRIKEEVLRGLEVIPRCNRGTYLADHPFTPLITQCPYIQLLQFFTVVLYDKTSNLGNVNNAQQELFCLTEKTTEKIPQDYSLSTYYPISLY